MSKYQTLQVLREHRSLAEMDPATISMVSVAAASNKRTVRLLRRRDDGRWDAETLTSITGAPISRNRKVTLSERTLDLHYRPPAESIDGAGAPAALL